MILTFPCRLYSDEFVNCVMYINNIYNQERLELMQFLLIPFCIDSQVFI